MNHFRPEKALSLSPLQEELELALHEEAMFAGTLLGEVATVRASKLADRLEVDRRRSRGAVLSSQDRHDAWEAYFTRLKF